DPHPSNDQGDPAAGSHAHAAADCKHFDHTRQGLLAGVTDLRGRTHVGSAVAVERDARSRGGLDRHRSDLCRDLLPALARRGTDATTLSGGLTMSYQWDWSALWDNLPLLMSGILRTLIATFATMAISLVVALPIGLARIHGRVLGSVAYIYIELFRNVP